jgi:hypothetical protein
MKKVSLFLVSLITLVALSIGFSSCGGGGNNNIRPSSISSVEDAKKYIDGKIFIGNPSNDLWYKLEFSGGRASLWSAMPQNGHWGSKKLSTSYEVQQARYTDNGQTYYYVMLGNPDDTFNFYKFDITGGRIYLNYGNDTGTSMKEGDRNPWN